MEIVEDDLARPAGAHKCPTTDGILHSKIEGTFAASRKGAGAQDLTDSRRRALKGRFSYRL